MAAFVQLAVFGVVLDFVIYRQTSTVVNTTQIALLWVSSDRLVEDMADMSSLCHVRRFVAQRKRSFHVFQ